MARTSLKRIRTFIEMYDKEQDIQVAEHDGPIKYVVIHKQFGPPWKMEYFCQNSNRCGWLCEPDYIQAADGR